MSCHPGEHTSVNTLPLLGLHPIRSHVPALIPNPCAGLHGNLAHAARPLQHRPAQLQPVREAAAVAARGPHQQQDRTGGGQEPGGGAQVLGGGLQPNPLVGLRVKAQRGREGGRARQARGCRAGE